MDPTLPHLAIALLGLALVGSAAFGLGRHLGRASERASASAESLRAAAERARFEAISQRVPVLEREIKAARDLVGEREGQLRDAQVRIAQLLTRLTDSEKAALEKLELMTRAEASMKNAFQALSADALDRSRAAFLDQARATFGEFRESALKEFAAKETSFAQLVSPIRESLNRFEIQVGEIEQRRTEAYSRSSSQPSAKARPCFAVRPRSS